MLNPNDLRYHTEIGTGYSKDAMLAKAADEIERLHGVIQEAAEMIRRCDYTPARSVLLTALKTPNK